MLSDLKIKNGNLELSFNEYTYEYTVVVDGDINSLEFEYKLQPGANLNVRGNNLKDDESIVYVDVFDEFETLTYTFYVYKESDEELVSGIDNFVNSLEVVKADDISLYKVQLLSVSIFLLLIILFSIIFKRKNISRK